MYRTRLRCQVLFWSLLLFLISGCMEDGVQLPEDYNTLKFRQITIKVGDKIEDTDPAHEVHALNGIHGSPLPVIDGGANLTYLYWGRPKGDSNSDGAHVNMVRVGSGTSCDVSLEAIFPNAVADVDAPGSYNFTALDAHVASIKSLNTATVLWQAALRPGSGQCLTSPEGWQLGEPIVDEEVSELTARVAFNTLRHLNNKTKPDDDPGKFDPVNSQDFNVNYVEFLDDPAATMGYTLDAAANYDELFSAFKQFSDLVKGEWPDGDDGPQVHVGGLSFTFTSADELLFSETYKHPLLRFIDFCDGIDPAAPDGAGLDFVSFKTRTKQPHEAYLIATSLKDYLKNRTSNLRDTQLIVTDIAIETTDPALVSVGIFADPELASAFAGAFEAATRVYMQDVPVDWAIAGRGPRVYPSLTPSNDIIVVESEYFQTGGIATPAFMMFFPFRQVGGHQRIRVTTGADTQAMAIMASHPKDSDRTIHVVIANAYVHEGQAFTTYNIKLEDMLPSCTQLSGTSSSDQCEVKYKFSVLDRSSTGVESFQFTDIGYLSVINSDGDVSFDKALTIPSVHYLQFVKPGVCEGNQALCWDGSDCSLKPGSETERYACQ